MKRRRGRSWEKFSERLTQWIGSTQSLLTHTVMFAGAFALVLAGIDTNTVLLFLTTIVSLEAIYLSIFIQMTVNRHAESLEEVEEDIGEIQEDVQELSEDIEDISEDIEEIQEDETKITLENIEEVLQKALKDLEQFKRQQ